MYEAVKAFFNQKKPVGKMIDTLIPTDKKLFQSPQLLHSVESQ